MKPADAARIVRARARDSGNIVLLDHARRQMKARRVDLLQVVRCLQRGAVTEGPYMPTNSRTGYWRCNVSATVDGIRLRVAVEVADDPLLLVVTAIVE